jgi:hypothetical protein
MMAWKFEPKPDAMTTMRHGETSWLAILGHSEIGVPSQGLSGIRGLWGKRKLSRYRFADPSGPDRDMLLFSLNNQAIRQEKLISK